MTADDLTAIETYLAGVPEPHRATLRATRAALRSILPGADEAIKYGMPTFVIAGKPIASYAAFKQHCSLFPHSSNVLDRAGDLIDPYETSKGGLRFAADRPLPKQIVRRLVRLRLDELADVADGKRVECYDNGVIKAEGQMRAGQLHGNWRWFRKDGSLMRTGSFRDGEQTGLWQTWRADGTLASSQQF
jgi:uncharacterized protein YdhG (YjbR/CyaY superfamily)